MTSVLAALWTAICAAARAPLGQIVIGATLLLALLWGAEAKGRVAGVAQGAAAERARWEARLAADAARARETAQRQAAAGAAVGEALAARQAQVRTVTQTLIREVPHYVTVEADARCDVPVGLVRLHDAAAAGLPAAADPAGRADDAASGLALSAVAAAVADNYGACHANAEALRGWQQWWAAVTPR